MRSGGWLRVGSTSLVGHRWWTVEHPADATLRCVEGVLLGLTLGFGAGIAPGPMLALVIRSALRGGFAAGARMAMTPLVTDVPVILAAVLLAGGLPEAALGVLGIAGGLFVIHLGLEALREDPVPHAAPGDVAADLRTGVVTNLLSPHPWLFWLTVGAPILADGGLGEDAVFLAVFYALLVGSKAAIAGVIALGRDRLVQGRGYALVLRGSGLLLLATGTLLLAEGITTVG